MTRKDAHVRDDRNPSILVQSESTNVQIEDTLGTTDIINGRIDNVVSEVTTDPTWIQTPPQTEITLWNLLLSGNLTEDHILELLSQVATKLSQYHQRRPQPVELQPQSVIVTLSEPPEIKIFSQLLDDMDYFEGFTAPEVMNGQPTLQSEVFSLGAYLFAGYYRRCPPSPKYLLTVLNNLNLNSKYLGVDYLLRKSLWPTPEQRLKDATDFAELVTHVIEYTKSPSASSIRFDISAEFHRGWNKAHLRGHHMRDVEDRLFWNINDGRQNFLFAVADGVSTASIGDGFTAADIVINKIAGSWEESQDQPLEDLYAGVELALEEANKEIVSEIKQIANKQGINNELSNDTMSTAFCVVCGHSHEICLANLGDVHAYLVTPVFVTRLNKTHTCVASCLGHNEPYDKLDRVSTSSLDQFVGVWCRNDQGEIQPDNLTLDRRNHIFRLNEVLVIASDGLYGPTSDPPGLFEDTLSEVLNKANNVSQAAFHLMTLANRRGGGDNISCIICRVAERT